jgi:hypothetical protein
MLQLMRCQYRDAMYPDPARDFGEMEARPGRFLGGDLTYHWKHNLFWEFDLV